VEKLTDEELSSHLKKAAAYEQAVKQLKSTALDRMLNGSTIDGFKLVLSTKHKRWIDADKVDSYLQRKGLKQRERFQMKLVSPSQAEKLLSAKGVMKPRVKDTLDKYTVRPTGDPVVAPVSSKKPEYVPSNPIDELPISMDDLL
jgi:uncharacterized phage protein (TIGR02220 family)